MKILNNQEIENLRPEILIALRLFDYFCSAEGYLLQVTWTTGGKHGKRSLHPKRRAFDALPLAKAGAYIIAACRQVLGPDYDIVEEKDHLHVEWDPK